MTSADVAIVGGGMAGASLAAEIAPHRSVILLEAEALPGHHATGRSAAFWTESYGGPGVQPLTTASGPWLARPPQAFAARGFLSRRGALHITNAPRAEALERFGAAFSRGSPRLDPIDRPAIERIVPGIRAGWNRGLIEASTADIDVAGLHAAYLAQAKRAGVELLCDARVRRITQSDAVWTIETTAGAVSAGVIVNAAGAWADEVAGIAGAQPIGIRAYRRTVVQLRVHPPAPAGLPLVLDAEGRFYFKPAGGRLWLSPHDETPHAPGEPGADEIDVALAIARLEEVVDWRIDRVERSWAGLRSFAPDRLPVYGHDPRLPGFFWFAGQGGFGIQTAPAAAKLGAALLLDHTPEVMVAGIDPRPYSPARFG